MFKFSQVTAIGEVSTLYKGRINPAAKLCYVSYFSTRGVKLEDGLSLTISRFQYALVCRLRPVKRRSDMIAWAVVGRDLVTFIQRGKI
jgi:hypothetical protein